MHSFFTLRRIFISAIILITFFSGCTRISSTDIGAGLIPPIDGVITKDTLLDVITDSFDDLDSARVYASDNHLVGAITNDPLFGKTTASLFFEMKPISFPYYIPGNKDSLVVDSAVLILSYRGVYGDSTKPLTLRLFEIDNNTKLDPALSYAVNYPPSSPINIGASLAPPVTVDIRRLKDSINNRYENANNQIRIKLNSAQALRFLKTYDSTTAYKSDSMFRTFFAGFALTADASGGANALLKINLVDTNSKFSLFYSSSSTGATIRDTSVAKFSFASGSAGHYNRVIRDKSGSEAATHFTTTSKPDSLVYVQTSPGSYVRVRIPGLQSLSNRIIHRAELIAEQVPYDPNRPLDEFLLPPRYLLLSRYDSSIKTLKNIPNDYSISSEGTPNISSFGGYLSSKSINGYDKVGSYTFDLSRYVQGIVTRKDTSYTLRLTAPSNDSLSYTPPYPNNLTSQLFYMTPSIGNDLGDGRVRLGGGTHSRFRMRLRVIFSRL
ncbi:MAG: DUF4270 family protein [Bacteroidota bacterium]